MKTTILPILTVFLFGTNIAQGDERLDSGFIYHHRVKRSNQEKNCKQVTCDFEARTSCQYHSFGAEAALKLGKKSDIDDLKTRVAARRRRLQTLKDTLAARRRRTKRQVYPTEYSQQRASLSSFFQGAGIDPSTKSMQKAAEDAEKIGRILAETRKGSKTNPVLAYLSADDQETAMARAAAAAIRREGGGGAAIADAVESGVDPKRLLEALYDVRPDPSKSAWDPRNGTTFGTALSDVNLGLGVSQGYISPTDRLDLSSGLAVTRGLSWGNQGYNWGKLAYDLAKLAEEFGPEATQAVIEHPLTWEIVTIRYAAGIPLNSQVRGRICSICNQIIQREVVNKQKTKDRWLYDRLPQICRVCGTVSGKIFSDIQRDIELDRWDEHGFTDEQLAEYEELLEKFDDPDSFIKEQLENNPLFVKTKEKKQAELPKLVEFKVVRKKFGTYKSMVKTEGSDYFMATYLHPGQNARFEADVNFREETELSFSYVEQGEKVQLRMCCDAIDLCPFQSSSSGTSSSGSESEEESPWQTGSGSCPKRTKTIIFYCESWGEDEAVCAVDDITMGDYECRQIYTKPKGK